MNPQQSASPDHAREQSPALLKAGTPGSLAVSRREAAALLGISERLLWTHTNAGTIPHVRIGGRVLYPVDALKRWLEARASAGMTSPVAIRDM